MIFKTNGVETLLDLSFSEILAEEAPSTVASRILLLKGKVAENKELQEQS